MPRSEAAERGKAMRRLRPSAGGPVNGHGRAAPTDDAREAQPRDPLDAGFTVVARRPRAEGGDGVPSPV